MDTQILIDLENLDREIARLQKSKKTIPRELTEMESELSAQKSALEEAVAHRKNRELECDHVIHSIDANMEALAKSNEKLSQVTREREYDAVLKELRDRKKMIEKDRKRHSRILKECDAAVTALEEAQATFDSLSAELQPKIDAHREQLSSIDTDIRAVEEKRPALIAQIPEVFRVVYDRIQAGRTNGRSLSHITVDSTYCTYCYQVITPKVAHDAQKSDRPVLCENCGSIFVVK
ncbi:zinc ribbon domain-containing protein [Chitinivibrio alkaliphilus]|uniref:Zn-ribbon protein n=1 Tax=Chitinivibrio alkaliphilus ACht1 TaxID=1313304 RepID=U7DAD2_9BACT|nr:Zn-ribbon protein [Chitinivibrio alkaliphilus]ERP31350.1 Zn-ribbon protein [Chitinivibrio alkaliphilus ACht1]